MICDLQVAYSNLVSFDLFVLFQWSAVFMLPFLVGEPLPSSLGAGDEGVVLHDCELSWVPRKSFF